MLKRREQLSISLGGKHIYITMKQCYFSDLSQSSLLYIHLCQEHTTMFIGIILHFKASTQVFVEIP